MNKKRNQGGWLKRYNPPPNELCSADDGGGGGYQGFVLWDTDWRTQLHLTLEKLLTSFGNCQQTCLNLFNRRNLSIVDLTVD